MTSVSVPPALEPIVSALGRAATTEKGRAIVGAHDEDYEVSVEGESGVILRFRGGSLAIVDVAEAAPAFCEYTRVGFFPATIDAVVAGDVTPAEAANNGGMLMRSRLYGGGQFMGLLRLAQKLELFHA